MTDVSDEPEITPEEAAAQFGLPIDHLMTIDPLDMTSDDLILLAQHYRNQRLNFAKMEERPKSVEKSRGPKLDAEKTKAEVNKILSNLGDIF